MKSQKSVLISALIFAFNLLAVDMAFARRNPPAGKSQPWIKREVDGSIKDVTGATVIVVLKSTNTTLGQYRADAKINATGAIDPDKKTENGVSTIVEETISGQWTTDTVSVTGTGTYTASFTWDDKHSGDRNDEELTKIVKIKVVNRLWKPSPDIQGGNVFPQTPSPVKPGQTLSFSVDNQKDFDTLEDGLLGRTLTIPDVTKKPEFKVASSIGSTIDGDGKYTAGNQNGSGKGGTDQVYAIVGDLPTPVTPPDEGTRDDVFAGETVKASIKVRFPISMTFIQKEPIQFPSSGTGWWQKLKFEVKDQDGVGISGVEMNEHPDTYCETLPGHSTQSHLGGVEVTGGTITDGSGYVWDRFGVTTSAADRSYVCDQTYDAEYGTYSKPGILSHVKIKVNDSRDGGEGNIRGVVYGPTNLNCDTPQ